MARFPEDPKWPRAAAWLASGNAADCDLAVLGVPACQTSISPTGAHETPKAVREALQRYSTWSASAQLDVGRLRAADLGDVHDPDGPAGEERVSQTVAARRGKQGLLLALGGDNSITYSVMKALAGGELGRWGLITIDAHHDLRDGESNGSPVWRLLQAGLRGKNVVQLGIADFANSPEYAQRASGSGITVVPRDELREGDLAEIAARALEIAGAGGAGVYVDLDVDVCDRSAAPGCPASAPGGISADELRRLAFLLASDPRVRAMDVAEIDATSDVADDRTVRLGALLVLEAAAGLAQRLGV